MVVWGWKSGFVLVSASDLEQVILLPPQNHHLFLFIRLGRLACGILVPGPGIEPVPSAVKPQSPNHWAAREFPETIPATVRCRVRLTHSVVNNVFRGAWT